MVPGLARIVRKLAPWALCALLVAAGSTRGAVVVAEAGAPKADVILARGATDDDKAAAYELIHYVQRCTGAELPLRTQRSAGRPAIVIGLAAAPEQVRNRAQRLGR